MTGLLVPVTMPTRGGKNRPRARPLDNERHTYTSPVRHCGPREPGTSPGTATSTGPPADRQPDSIGCRPWLAEFKGRPGKKLPDLTNARRARARCPYCTKKTTRPDQRETSPGQMPVLYGQGRTQGHWQFRAAPIYLGCHKRVIVSM